MEQGFTGLQGTECSKIYRKSLLNLSFDDGLNLSSFDFFWGGRLILSILLLLVKKIEKVDFLIFFSL